MMVVRHLLAIACVGVLGSGWLGCRCGTSPSENDLPSARPSPASSRDVPSTGKCPARPKWAGPLADDVELELLHASEQGKTQHGTGYRLHLDGKFETYDDIKVEKNDAGKMVFNRVEGKWSDRGKLAPKGITTLRAAISERADSVTGKWRTKGPTTSMTLLTTRREGKLSELCYLGTDAPAPFQPIEKKIHDLVNSIEPGK